MKIAIKSKQTKASIQVERKKKVEETDTSGNDKTDWSNNENMDFINILGKNPTLLDAFHKNYSKCEVKAIAYSSLVAAFETNVSSIKTKINGLSAQSEQGKAKESKTKSVKSTEELYQSSWLHCERWSFPSCYRRLQK